MGPTLFGYFLVSKSTPPVGTVDKIFILSRNPVRSITYPAPTSTTKNSTGVSGSGLKTQVTGSLSNLRRYYRRAILRSIAITVNSTTCNKQLISLSSITYLRNYLVYIKSNIIKKIAGLVILPGNFYFQ